MARLICLSACLKILRGGGQPDQTQFLASTDCQTATDGRADYQSVFLVDALYAPWVYTLIVSRAFFSLSTVPDASVALAEPKRDWQLLCRCRLHATTTAATNSPPWITARFRRETAAHQQDLFVAAEDESRVFWRWAADRACSKVRPAYLERQAPPHISLRRASERQTRRARAEAHAFSYAHTSAQRNSAGFCRRTNRSAGTTHDKSQGPGNELTHNMRFIFALSGQRRPLRKNSVGSSATSVSSVSALLAATARPSWLASRRLDRLIFLRGRQRPAFNPLCTRVARVPLPPSLGRPIRASTELSVWPFAICWRCTSSCGELQTQSGRVSE